MASNSEAISENFLDVGEDHPEESQTLKKRGKRSQPNEDSDEEWGAKGSRNSKKKHESSRNIKRDKSQTEDESAENWNERENRRQFTTFGESLDKFEDDEESQPSLFYDDEDQQRLMSMPEIEREKILFQRAEERQALLERKELAKKLEIVETERSKFAQRQGSRLRTKEPSRLASLNKLRSRREQHRFQSSGKLADSEKHRVKNKESQYSDEADESEDQYSSDAYQKTSDEDDENFEELDGRVSFKPKKIGISKVSDHAFEERAEEEKKSITVDDMNALRLTRNRLEHWIHMPFFNEAVKGYFVRIQVASAKRDAISGTTLPKYRAGEVLDVIEQNKLYPLGRTKTNKLLLVRWGRDQRNFRMEYVSNADITQEEYRKYVAFTSDAELPIMNAKKARDLKTVLKQWKDTPIKNEEIEFSLQERKRLGIAVRNYALEKNSILREREVAMTEGNQNEITKLDSALRELEKEAANRGRDTRLEDLTRLNQKNRQKNFLTLNHTIKPEGSKGIDDLDPFARRKCRPLLFNSSPKLSSKNSETNIDDDLKTMHNCSVTGIPDSNSQHQKLISTTQNVDDLLAAHSFDLEINLDHLEIKPMANQSKGQ